MLIVEYRLVKKEDGGMVQPWWIKDGGHFRSPIDNSMIGIAYDREEVEYDLPDSLVPLTKADLVARQLAIHTVVPAQKLVDADGNPVYAPRVEGAHLVDMTEAEVTTEAETWYENYIANHIPENVTPAMLDTLKTRKINEAFAKMEEKLEDAYVEVLIDSMNANMPFGCDKVTQENIMGINTAINAGIPVPNPTYWTPKGHITPVQVTHTELKTIGGAILDKKNEYYQQYFTHKAVISNAVDYTAIMLYDYSTGYES